MRRTLIYLAVMTYLGTFRQQQPAPLFGHCRFPASWWR